jgi:hypothetical protein
MEPLFAAPAAWDHWAVCPGAILNTAVADEIIDRNPCRVRAAGKDRSAERPTAAVAQVGGIKERRSWCISRLEVESRDPCWRYQCRYPTISPLEVA